MKDALKAVWESRTRRDRIAIGATIILVALSIAYAYAWLPVSRERDQLFVRVPELRAAAQAMDRDARELERLRALVGPAAGLATAIEQAGGASGLTARAVQVVQRDPASARVTIASVRAEGALTWIARLQSLPGIRLENLRLTSIGDGDRVNVDAVLVAR